MIPLPNSIDVHSLTWKAVLEHIEVERAKAVKGLIADVSAEQQRGIISCLDRLEALPVTEESELITEVDYN